MLNSPSFEFGGVVSGLAGLAGFGVLAAPAGITGLAVLAEPVAPAELDVFFWVLFRMAVVLPDSK
jgi:hypothetical protein